MAGQTYSQAGGVPEAGGYLGQLIASINDSARTARTAMTTLLVVIVYLGAACLAADHEALLRGGATSIPQVGVRLPLVASFALAPPVVLFLHVALLVQLDLLAQKIRRFRDETARIPIESQRRAYRLLIFPFAFAQTHLESWRIAHQPMIVLSWLAVVALPFAVLLIVLLRFLPYQDATLTFSHQLWIVLDSVTLWFFQLRRHPYPTIAGPRDRFDLRARQHGHVAYRRVFLPGLVVALAVGVFQQARIPAAGEGDVRSDIAAEDVPNDPAAAKDVANLLDWACAEYDFPCRYIKLTDRTLLRREAPRALVTKYDDDEKKLNAALKRHADGLFLRGRSLRYADLQRANLYRADLVGADLRGARLDQAGLAYAVVRAARLDSAWMRGADLTEANFVLAKLNKARMECMDVKIPKAQSGNAPSGFFACTQLQGADLRYARLQGADLGSARLEGADLRYARLEGADLGYASLQGADLRGLRFDTLPDSAYDAIRTVLESAIKNEAWRKQVLALLDRGRKAGPAGFPAGMRQSAARTEIFDRHALFKDWNTPVHGGDEAKYFALLVPQLAKLACDVPEAAPGLAQRAVELSRFDAAVPGLARALLEAPCFGNLKLSDRVVDGLKKERHRQAAKKPSKGRKLEKEK